MKFKIYKNISDCGRLWKKFSTDKKLFDIWEYRSCFYNRKDYSPYFIAAKDKGRIVGMLPLLYVKNDNNYTYFGDWFPERNTIFLKDKSNLPLLLEKCPAKTKLHGIDPAEKRYFNFKEDEYTYFLDLAKYNQSFDKFFTSFDKKKQKNFRQELKSVPKHKVYYNRLKDYNRLVELNIKQFDNESLFTEKPAAAAMKRLVMKAYRKRMLNMVSVQINGKVEAIDLGIRADGWYHVVTGGSNNHKIPNLGKLITVLTIKNAIKKGTKIVDFLATSGHWKSQWHFDKEMLLKYEN